MPKKRKNDRSDEAAPAAQVDAAKYNEVVARATLKGIRLIKSSFEAKPSAFGPNSGNRKLAVDYGATDHKFDPDTGRLTGLFRFAATWKSGRSRELMVEGEFLVDYQVAGACSAEAAELYVERLGPFAAYPYFRALHGMLLSQAGLPTPPLPILAEAPRRIARAEEVVMAHDNPLLEQPAQGGD